MGADLSAKQNKEVFSMIGEYKLDIQEAEIINSLDNKIKIANLKYSIVSDVECIIDLRKTYAMNQHKATQRNHEIDEFRVSIKQKNNKLLALAKKEDITRKYDIAEFFQRAQGDKNFISTLESNLLPKIDKLLSNAREAEIDKSDNRSNTPGAS